MNEKNFSEKQLLAARQRTSEENYWLNQLAGYTWKSSFPYHHRLPKQKKPTPEPSMKTISSSLEINGNRSLGERLLAVGQGSDYALHIILLTGTAALLYKYTGHNDIVLGTPIYKQETGGDFINTLLVIRNRWQHKITFEELLTLTRNTLWEATENQNYPMEILAEKLEITGAENSLLTDTAVLLENIHDKTYLRHFHLNMVFSFNRVGQCIEVTLEYNPLSYLEREVRGIGGHFINLMHQVLDKPGKPLALIDILSGEEKKKLLVEFNDTAASYPDKCLHELFQDRVKQFPDRTALVSKDLQLTYREVDLEAETTADFLRYRGVKSDVIVGLLLEPSARMVTAILGILKAGGAYLPIDPHYPTDRVRAVLNDSRVPLLLTQQQTASQYPFNSLQNPGKLKTKPAGLEVTPRRPQIKNLDCLPIPDRSTVNYEKYTRYIGQTMGRYNITMQATRGCPYKCAFCHKIWPKAHVYRSAEHIFEEVRLYYNIGIRRFAFIDDIFNFNVKNSRRFFELIIENKLQVNFFYPAGLRGDILTRDYIDLMVKAGTVNMALALETASPRLQKKIGKNLNIEKLHENLCYICKTYPQVILELFIMSGFPTETKEEARMTMEFIKSLKWIHFNYLAILKIYPNTDMETLALENGITREAIDHSQILAFHELPDTLPFEKSFMAKFQANLFNEYFLSQERLKHVLPYQVKILTENEIVQKYNSYLPVKINKFAELLQFLKISTEELSAKDCLEESRLEISGLNEKIKQHFPGKKAEPGAMRILLLDLSQYFSGEVDMLFDVVEPPLGLMSLMAYLDQQLGSRVCGKIAKSWIDFDNCGELKVLVDEFKPDIIGLRTLTLFKEFFHRIAALLHQWNPEIPIIAGGPYATSDYPSILQDPHIRLAVLGEGEITFCQLIEEMLKNKKKLPPDSVLKEIKGIAYISGPHNAHQGHSTELVLLDDGITAPIGKPALSSTPGTSGPHPSYPSHLAYVIFTSGSTGKPKGTLISHKNVMRLMINDKYLFDFTHRDVWTMFHSYCFDFSVWEMYGALIYGGKLIVLSRDVPRNPGKFLGILKKEKVTVLNQTPSAFYYLMEEESRTPVPQLNTRYVIFGGERLEPARLEKWKERYPAARLINMYGITETTVHVTYKEITPAAIESGESNIGKPIPTLSTYIMDRDLNLLPIGVPGELCVGGEGVARGYLNRPELTHEKITTNPHLSPQEKLYRSGDLAVLSGTGEMVYLGRIDEQVKIRGYRVEPEEIQRQLLNFPPLKDALVTLLTDRAGDQYLAAYLVPDPDSAPILLKWLELENLDISLPPCVQLYQLPNGKPVFHLNRSETDYMYREIFEERCYLQHGLALAPGACVVDVGANIGLFSLFVKETCPDAEIYAFEPIPTVYEVLQLNTSIVIHGQEREKGRIKIFNYGLAATEGEINFTYYPNVTVLSGCATTSGEEIKNAAAFIHNRELKEQGENTLSSREIDELLMARLSNEQVKCTVKTLSAVIREQAIERIDFLKIDVEQSEIQVLEGIEEKDWGKIHQLAIEVHNTSQQLQEIVKILETRGYRVLIQQDELLKNTRLYNVYAVFPGKEEKKQQAPLHTSASTTQYHSAWNTPGRFIDELKSILRQKLPDYMIPSRFVLLESLPLTPNGKINRQALPDPDRSSDQTPGYTPPGNEREKTMVSVWQGVLAKERIGISEDFFDLGGDSIKAIKVISRLKEHQIDISIETLFLNPTIQGISQALTLSPQCAINNTMTEPPGQTKIPAGSGTVGNTPLKKSPPHAGTKTWKEDIQRQLNKNRDLSLLLKKNKVLHTFPVLPLHRIALSSKQRERIAEMMVLCSYHLDKSMEIQGIKEIILQLVNNNTLLKTIIVKRGEEYLFLEFASFSNLQPPYLDISMYPPDNQQEILHMIDMEFLKPLSVIENLLYRFMVLKLSQTHYKVVFSFNHLIFDGLSICIVKNTLEKLSHGLPEGEINKPGSSYRDYVNFLERQDYSGINLEKYLKISDYFENVEKSFEHFDIGTSQYISFELDISNLNENLKNFYNEVILLCNTQVIGELFGLENIPITFISYGRSYKDGSFHETIGDLHDYIPLLFHLKQDPGPAVVMEKLIDFRKYIKENNLNFTIFMAKNYQGPAKLSQFRSPFLFNSLFGLYDFFKENTQNDPLVESLEGRIKGGKIFSIEISKDFKSDWLWVNYCHNSPFSKEKIKEVFLRNYLKYSKELNVCFGQ
jgi:amino acid adenylation domain-containing protein/FkbM family methyltransferase